jgi:hypothetical protein
MSAARELVPQLKDNESLNAQLQAVQLNGVCTSSTLVSTIEMVLKLSEEVYHLCKDNGNLKIKKFPSLYDPICCHMFRSCCMTGHDVTHAFPG